MTYAMISPMEKILSTHTVSITELKKSPGKIIKAAKGDSVAILNRNTVASYLVPADMYETLLDAFHDQLLAQKVEQRLNDNEQPIRVSLDEL